jgi:hypothetical protein
MFCENCGTQIPDDAKFCPNCGQVFENGEAAQAPVVPEVPPVPVPPVVPQPVEQSVVQQPVAPEQQFVQPQPGMPGQQFGQQPYMPQFAGEKPKKKAPGFLIPLLLILAIVALIAVVAVMLLSKGSGSGTKGAVLARISSTNGVLFADEAFYDLKGGSEDMDDYIYGRYSMDQSMYLYSDDDNDLYYIKHDLKPEKVAKNVSDVDRVLISVDNNTIVYQDESDNLYTYNVKTKASEKIAKDVRSYGEFSMSPDGKYVAYVNEDDDLYLYNGKESVKADKKVDNVVAVFSANRIYYRKSEKLYLYNGKEGNKVLSDYSNLCFNRDGSQILYNDNNNKVCIYEVRKDESTKIGKGSVYGVYCPKDYSMSTKVKSNGYTYAYMIDSFKNQIIGTGNGTYWVNNKMTDTVKITSDDVYFMYISNSGKSMLYLDGNKLYYVPKIGEKMEEKLLAKNVDDVAANGDLSVIYYQKDDEIYYITTSGKETLITDDYDDEGFALNNADGALYVIIDDDLYKAGKKEDSLEKIEKDVEFVVGSGGYPNFYGVVYGTYDDDYYYIEKGKPTKFN